MSFPEIANAVKNPAELKKLFLPDPVLIGDLVIDVLSFEDVTYAYEITSKPIESGFKISEAKIKKPVRIRCEGVLTDSALTPSALASGFISGSGFSLDTWQDKKDQLKLIADRSELIDITFRLDFYPNMLIDQLKIEQRVGDKVKACFFTIEAQEVKIVSSEIVGVDPSQIPKELADKKEDRHKKGEKKASKLKDKGNKTTDPTQEKEKSWLAQLAGGLFG